MLKWKQKLQTNQIIKMMFCGGCTTDNEHENEIQIRDSYNNDIFQRIDPTNEQLMTQVMRQIPRFSMLVPSNYQKQLKSCKQKGKKFVDSAFPPNQASLNFSVNNRKIGWKRITEVVPNAKIVSDSIDPADVQQGNAGDCYFLACLSSIAEVPERIKRIFCHSMEISPEGIYRMQIVDQGIYKQVIIDDYIPVFEGTNRPVFCRPIGNQVWVMLLEKVWAKVSGSYGDTSAGYPHEVLNTFLVAPCYYHDIPFSLLKDPQQKAKLWQKIKKASDCDMVVCAGSRQAYTCKGIRSAHTYSVLDAYEIPLGHETISLLKLRNPWGDSEYEGRFSQHDNLFWSKVDPILKLSIFKKLNEEDGIFTIEFNQFIRNFQCIDISHDIPDYNNFFVQSKVLSCKPTYFSFKIEDTADLDCYITAEKAFDRNEYIRTRKVEYGYTRLLIAKKKEIESNESKTTFQYVSSVLQTNFPDLTLQERLSPGEYIVMVESQFVNQDSGNLTMSIYSKSVMSMEQIECPTRLFLHSVLINHAHHQIPAETRVKLSQSPGDWMVSKFLFKEGGYGYMCVCLAENSKEKVQISCNISKIYDSGFLVLERDVGKEGQLNILVEANQQAIIILGIDFKRNIKEITFPPKGIRLARVI